MPNPLGRLADHVGRRLLGLSSTRPRSRVTEWVFLRGLGAVYFIAFTSLGAQLLGLYGSRGVLPVRDELDWARAALRPKERRRLIPSVFWLDASDATLVGACRAGRILSLLLVFNIAPRLTLCLLWALYLSFVSVGGDFLSFQWDALLLEAGLHALVVAPRGVRPKIGREDLSWQAVMLMRWLVFRLHYESGIAKLRSGDTTWRDRTACCYHYETQPLPTPIGWYAHHLPKSVQRFSTAIALLGECVVPFLTFAPRRLRRLGFGLLTGLQGAIAATGNYGFFNVLTAVLDVWLVDDDLLLKALPLHPPEPAIRRRGMRRFATAIAASVLFALSAAVHLLRYGRRRPPRFVIRAIDWALPLRSINAYGLFSTMTVRRPEIAIEGSDDGAHWLEYEFRYKIGDPRRRPRWVAPHQPRLDWQMWFAALELSPPTWFVRLLVRLLEGSPEVIALFEHCPFDRRPPRYIRAILYEYRMTDLETRRRTGAWWQREPLGLYFPAVSLSSASHAE